MDASSAAVGGALEAPRIDFPPMEGAPFLARWLGLAPRFDVMATLEKGPLCYTTVLGKRIYFVNDAEFVKRILLDNVANYPKSVTYRNNLRPFLGDGLLISEGDFWKRQRRLAQPAFHLRRLKALAGAMAEAAGHMTKDWVHGKVIDVMAAMNAVTMEIVATTLFGADVSGDIAEVADAMTVLQEETGRIGPTAFFELPEFLVRPRGRRFSAAVATLDRIVNRIVAERRASGETRDDLLSMLLEARDEETGEGMTDKQLRDELVTLFLAGHETTAIALTWTFHLLAQTPARRGDAAGRGGRGAGRARRRRRSTTSSGCPTRAWSRKKRCACIRPPTCSAAARRARTSSAPTACRRTRTSSSAPTRCTGGPTTGPSPTPSGPSASPPARAPTARNSPTCPSAAARASASATPSP